jgi:transcriptional regulator with XRE-family HTH domain
VSARAPQSHDCTLSQAQVAARAGLSLRYQEYLERYPPRPAEAALRQLAAALRTTPAALLGAGTNVPPGQRRLARSSPQADWPTRLTRW